MGFTQDQEREGRQRSEGDVRATSSSSHLWVFHSKAQKSWKKIFIVPHGRKPRESNFLTPTVPVVGFELTAPPQ